METKKTQTRGRPKKDFWELKSKLAVEHIQNKWKFGRGRPKKERKIDDSINTKISNHNKDINNLEKKNHEIYSNILDNNLNGSNIDKINEQDTKAEKYSRFLLIFAVLFFICTIVYKFSLPKESNNTISISEIDQEIVDETQNDSEVQLQIWYNNQDDEFIEIEKIEIDGNINNEQENDEYVNLIRSFYDKINNREFSELSSITDRYLQDSGPFKTYYSSNRLSNFLNKIDGGRIYLVWIKELPSNKSNVKNYWYTIKYKVKWIDNLTEEEREMAIVNRNWKNLIWSVMCVTTWCSKMPFFQK